MRGTRVVGVVVGLLVLLVGCAAPPGPEPAAPSAGAPADRPQEPQPPFPYRSEDVGFPSGDVTLTGTLTLPEGAGPHVAVSLISGSGPQDRDGTVAGHRQFLLLADTLTRAGYAVLRVDDRGVGGSGGALADADYADLTGDALAGVAYLRGRAEIDPARVGLLGHSEGGYIAPLAAQRAPEQVAFVVSMAGPAVPGEDVVLEQNRLILPQAGLTPEQVDAQLAFLRELIGLLRAGDRDGAATLAREATVASNESFPPDQRLDPEEVEELVAASLSLEAFVLHDPAPALQALRVPVLAFFGGTDVQVPAAQSEEPIRRLLASNPDTTVVTLPGLNHLMQPSETGAITEYGDITTTIAPEALDLITSWLRARF